MERAVSQIFYLGHTFYLIENKTGKFYYFLKIFYSKFHKTKTRTHKKI